LLRNDVSICENCTGGFSGKLTSNKLLAASGSL
jgi:hypothetical protein